MTIKLAILKSGEDIIADIHEMIVGEGEEEKTVGYFFTKPCVVALGETQSLEDDKKTIEIKMSPWVPLTKTTQIPVSLDWVVTIVDPVDKLKEMYEKDVLKNGNKSNQSGSVNESASSDNTD